MATRMSSAMPQGLRYEPTPKRIRALLDGETVLDTRGAVLVWEPDRSVPVYAIPREDVALERLAPAQRRDGGDHPAPVATIHAVRAREDTADGAAWTYADDDLDGYVAIRWDAADRWLEEEEEVVGHPRDPFHRIDVRESSRRIEVEIGGERLAESTRPWLLFETGLPVRHYIPREDVRMDVLEESETRTTCAYKGRAVHFSARAGGTLHEDVAWSYPEPLPDNWMIKDLVCFYGERTDIRLDGEALERPRTQWSSG